MTRALDRDFYDSIVYFPMKFTLHKLRVFHSLLKKAKCFTENVTKNYYKYGDCENSRAIELNINLLTLKNYFYLQNLSILQFVELSQLDLKHIPRYLKNDYLEILTSYNL